MSAPATREHTIGVRPAHGARVDRPDLNRLAPAQRPADRPAGFQRWRTLAFLHWEVPAEAVAALLPRGLEVDTFEGRAYVGVVPFTMRDVSPWWSPSVPGVSNFHELNVRTYVHAQGEPGVWFFCLEASSSIAVIAARTGWHLPYHRAAMSLDAQLDPATGEGEVVYQSRRLWPGPAPADVDVRYRVGERIGAAQPGTFEHFLAERYLLFANHGEEILRGQVHHAPYPLHRAEVLEVRESIVAATGLPETSGPPHALFSPGVDVDVYALRPLGT